MSNKITALDWQEIKHFKPDERWGEWKKVDLALVCYLDSYRELVNTPIYISCATQGKHSPNSYHYQGKAVDILFPNKVLADLPYLVSAAEQIGFTGIGIYNNWHLHEVLTPGMHLDIRPGSLKKWIGIENLYLPYDEVNIKRYFA